MQNKGLVVTLAVCLALVSAFYLSFSFVTRYYDNKAEEYAQGDVDKKKEYLDSVNLEKVWFGYTLKACREKEINLGLDLKGGMNVTMEVSVQDVLNELSGKNQSPAYVNAIAAAEASSEDDYLTAFFNSLEQSKVSYASIFSSMALKDKVKLDSSNEDVEKVVRAEVEGAIENAFNVLRTRIDRFGVVQPNIQKLGKTGRILIELPGVKEPERVEKLLQASANLEFWETYEFKDILPLLVKVDEALTSKEDVAPAAEKAPQVEVSENDVDNIITDTAVVADAKEESVAPTQATNALFAKLIPALAQTGQPMDGPVVGTAKLNDMAKVDSMLSTDVARSILPRDLKFAWTVKAIDKAETQYQLIALKSSGTDLSPALTGDVITDARADFGQVSAYANVSMSMNSEGARRWQLITRNNKDKSIAIVLDGYVYSFPRVENEIPGGNSQITGNFTVDEAKDLANTLNSGKMPASAHIIDKAVVGPSLGQAAIKDGLWSFAIGFLLIMLYMVFYYGLIPGMIANFALLCNVFLLVGVLSSFSAVLTLPGIAGIVLTMGMAVDANVLIYERIREEMRGGKNMRKAIQDGFGNAISAIIDSNVTSFLTGAILAIFGSGPIKGFAVTYMIGIISSFLTSVFICRLLLEQYAKKESAKELSFTTRIMKNFLQNTNMNFIGARKITYIISGAMVVIGILGVTPSVMGKLNLGIDFSGGRNYVISFEQSVNTDDVRNSLETVFMDTKAELGDEENFSLNVITYGEGNQVRVSTNFLVNNKSNEAEDIITKALYEGCKPFLADNITFDDFKDTQTNDKVGIMQSQMVGPAVASDITESAIWAVLAAMLVIFLYIFVRFRNVAFSVGALVGLAHDTLIILGLYAILWKVMPFSMEIDQSFIAAILTVIGYSINDTVVVFDRVREYKGLYPKRDLKLNINNALNHTLSRTFSTSMSTFVVLLAIFCFGGETIRGFVFALLIGVIVGTYSTLCVATPLAYDIQAALNRRKEKKAAKN
ncbi:MAG: protein translocase subunit SecDF [Paludibacteraceae bacterium]|nr:protein translocase subunit SecDF [Paludibacteraceae bacterium]